MRVSDCISYVCSSDLHCAQCVRVKLWIPGTMRPVVVSQNADQSIGEIGDLGRMDRFVGARQQSCLRNLEMAEIDRIAGPELGQIGRASVRERGWKDV